MYSLSPNEYKELEDWVRAYIDRICIVRNTRMPGKRPGTWYTWQFYLRRGLFNHQFLSAVAQMFFYKMEQEYPGLDYQITGLETGATPMVAGFPLIGRVMGRDVNAFIVRKHRKEYGLLNIIEGVPDSRPALIMDDLCNSSSSMAQCYRSLLDENISVAPVAFSIVNKSNKKIHPELRLRTDMFLPPSIRVLSLFDLDDFNLSNPSH